MSEILKPSSVNKNKANWLQRTALTALVLTGCNASINEQNLEQTPQPVPTPSGKNIPSELEFVNTPTLTPTKTPAPTEILSYMVQQTPTAPREYLVYNCEPFNVPDWEAHNAKEFACPKKSAGEDERVNITLRKNGEGVSAGTSISNSKDPGEKTIINFMPFNDKTAFTSPINDNCRIEITTSNQPDSLRVDQVCKIK
ncbi:MAG: hypothetical protein ACD_50C00153G0020 [uncultured bacterium]|nr:MAG: hypothetical protein ACD_50C00153G0020 [uncultured bacterium]